MKEQYNNPDSIIEFYNRESVSYSDKRYAPETRTYVQYFFKRRLEIVIGCIKDILLKISSKEGLTVIEDGCADGVVLREVERVFPGVFTMIGTDIAELMIRQARKANTNPRASFYVKNGGDIPVTDIFLAIGFLSPDIFEEEFGFMKKQLKSGGYLVCSLPSKYSVHARLKLADKEYAQRYLSYEEYERIFSEHFVIEKKVPYGLFVPKLWAFSAVGRTFQPIIDKLFAHIAGNLFHECIYVMRKKN